MVSHENEEAGVLFELGRGARIECRGETWRRRDGDEVNGDDEPRDGGTELF